VAASLRKTIFVNAAITFMLLALTEFGAWIALSIHEGNIEARNTAMLWGQGKPDAATPDASAYSNPEVRRDLDRAKEVGYRHEPYLVYLPNAFQSNYVNISKAGFRLNGTKPYPATINHKVWMFGSSALYGVSNADSETIPAYIERLLADRHEGRTFQVRNFGIVGYSSLQDLIQLKYRLLTDKPDLVIVFSGVNDHYNAWLAPTVEDAMLATNVMPRDTLRYYAELHRREGLVNWRMVAVDLRGLFSHTITFAEKAVKYFRLRSANGNVAAWKDAYRKIAEQDLTRARKVVPHMRRLYTDNLREVASLARAHGAKVIMIHQPLLFASPKPLVGPEPAENLHPRFSFFAMPAKELEALNEVPSYRLVQTAYWDFDYFLETYREQAKALKDVAAGVGAGYVDAQAIVDAAGPVAVFTSPYHFTFRGARLLALGIVPEVERQLGLKPKD
jgi:lysophospholipase L1-like esterase